MRYKKVFVAVLLSALSMACALMTGDQTAAPAPTAEPGDCEQQVFAGEIAFGAGDESYSVQVDHGRVVGGHARGRLEWNATSGFYDGEYLQVTFIATQDNGCRTRWTHYYRVESQQVVLLESIDGCGDWIKGRSIAYPRFE